ncbi:hypothetical protein FP435_06525 [Lactobacillus sp. PV037]|uniref:P8 family protein n=1 Tax=unclassified Lactobacillus TaxID=2620435 RepID=UPI00223F033B|nr:MULTISPECIES: hypothetical protein [unclassified Lactobacillus]QNQ81864.1 hypothetical protein FP433_01720 [Lactobacillus sp. PV012]QNQ84097.1 hypothetical protein FP435_06525 [Lactobacillus sp. PV037]
MDEKMTNFLDKPLKEVLENTKEEISVREWMWNFFLEKSGHDTLKAEEEMLPWLEEKDIEILNFIQKNSK